MTLLYIARNNRCWVFADAIFGPYASVPRFHYCLKPLYLRDSDTLDGEAGGEGEGKAIRLFKGEVNICCNITGKEGHTRVTDKMKNSVAYP